jgi:hypothetical protein
MNEKMRALKEEHDVDLTDLKFFPDQSSLQAKAKEIAKFLAYGEISITTISISSCLGVHNLLNTRVARLGAYLLMMEAELWADPKYKFKPKNKPGDQSQPKASVDSKDQQIAYWKEKYEEMVSLIIFVY